MKLHKLLLPCLLALLAPAMAQANDFGNLAMAGIYGYGGACSNRAGVINSFTPPYFSLHPPVYYGDRYYRPYGESPYASWPQLQPNPAYMPKLQPRAEQVAILAIQNPHYVPQAAHYAPQAPAYLPEVRQSVIEQPSAQPAQLNTQPHTQPNAKPNAEPVKPKNPDVVTRPVGPLTIPNPYFTESKQYISKQQ